MQNDKHAVLWALLTVVFWSTASTAFKIALRDLSPIQLLWVASLTSTFVLMLSLIWQNKWSALKAQSTAELFRSLGLGILNPVAYYIVLFEAYSRLPAQMAQPLNYTWPLVLVFLSAIILKQQIHLKSYIALIVSFVGVVIIASKGS
jgi:drug/metabolite transporter (DMT)-like permease